MIRLCQLRRRKMVFKNIRKFILKDVFIFENEILNYKSGIIFHFLFQQRGV